MDRVNSFKFSSSILKKAQEFGADLVGITSVAELKECPSYTAAPKIPQVEVGQRESDLEPGEVDWPAGAKSVIVIAISHPEDEPELDYWYGKHAPPGNQKLVDTVDKLIEWINDNYEEVEAHHIPYHVEKGGIFLKDAAAMAGLGCVGKNNLFVSPEYGPRVRLRALIVDVDLPVTGPTDFDPCADCEKYCLQKCPQGSFSSIIYEAAEIGQEILPGRIGNYSRFKCNEQMEKDIEKAEERNEMVKHEPSGEMVQLLKYCRNCELSCPIGKE
ncbi:epoxyqueuosine reductase [Fuchsiella alkaliacetigena]|uniref:epoxyqueuosine reductase n=1 Tax=Fuchsiella alkaliacetigena TaxID=957042 RepID=UPI00200B2F2F|nr:epoxyqueuosine reductase [Fuchsiella alkaliacetigena]MCK8825960.1 epoxyqueuosine reductase [Fuchsiella alkaliacetigena]